MRAEEIKGLMEAYSKVHEIPEVLSEEVVGEEIEQLDEAPMTAFQAAGGQAKLNQLNKGRSPRSGRATAASIEALGQQNLYKAGGGDAAISKGPTRTQNVRGGSTRQVPTLTRQDIINRGTVAAAKPSSTSKPAAAPATRPAAAPATRPAAAPAASRPSTSPAATPAAKPAATSAAKPSTSAPKPSAMDQWRSANKGLAAAADEKARIRGTSQTDNPLMKDFKPKMSMTPSVQSPTLAKDLGKGSGNQSLTGNVSAAKAATPAPKPTPTPAATSAPKPSTPAPAAAPAAAPKPQMSARAQALKAGGPSTGARAKVLNQDLDLFDIVKGYLLDEGYAETEEGAMVIMVNMSEEWRQSILESCGVQLDEIAPLVAGGLAAGALYAAGKGMEAMKGAVDKKINAARKTSKIGGDRYSSQMKQLNQSYQPEGEEIEESALGTMAVLGGMAAGRAIHGKLEKRKAKKELESKRKTSDYLIMKDKTKKVVARDRAASGDTRKEDLEAWVDELIAEGYDLSGYTWEEVAEIYAQELELVEAQRARENPEENEKEHEKEHEKKYGHVRGEKTPMPPRGDKRREEFEKWYAKQMGR